MLFKISLNISEATSALDSETEEIILSNLKKVQKNRTTIIVSHRISSAKNADKIIILDEGKIIQEGSHNQLVNQEGYYKELYYNNNLIPQLKIKYRYFHFYLLSFLLCSSFSGSFHWCWIFT